jgi:hypothetical protein
MVTWIDGALTSPSPARREQVLSVENRLRVDLPPDFLAVAATHQGAAPSPAHIKLPNGTWSSVAHLFHFEDSPFTSNILAAAFPWRDSLDKGVIPFAADIGGDLFCFNYRADYGNPPVVHFSVDNGMLPLAASFSDFVALLTDEH